MISDIWTFTTLSMPTMIVLGMRHGLDIDHITAIDNLVRLHDATSKSQWAGAGFGIGHMLSVFAEMLLIICLVGSITDARNMVLSGGIAGAIALGVIGTINMYSMKKWGEWIGNFSQQNISQKRHPRTFRRGASYRYCIWIRF